MIIREERKKEKIKKRMQMTEQGSAEERERKKMRQVYRFANISQII